MTFTGPMLVAANVVAWGCIHAGTGWYAHRLPPERIRRDTLLWREWAWERQGRIYEKLGIRRWKDRLPEAGDVFPGGVSKRRLASYDDSGLVGFAAETRRAELGHWLAVVASPVFALWNQLPIVAVMVAYGLAANLPFIAIQRYNRQRIARIGVRRAERESGRR